MASFIKADRPCCCRRQIDVPTSDPWAAIINTNCHTSAMTDHNKRAERQGTMRGRKSRAIQALTVCKTKWLRAAFLSCCPRCEIKPGNPLKRGGTVTNFDLFDACPFLLAQRRAAVCFSGRTDCWGLFLGSTTSRCVGERRWMVGRKQSR